MEQGQILLKIREIWQTKKLTLVGLETSIKTQSGRGFFQGPWIYYLPLPVLLISNWNPLSASYFFIFLNLAALIILYLAVKEKYNNTTAFLAGLFFSLMPNMIHFSQFIWNPNFLPFASCLVIYFWIKLQKNARSIYFLLSGLTLGFGLGCHYQFLLIIIGFIGWMIYKRYPLSYFFFVLTGIVISFSPLIIFEFKHNFYNLKTVALILQEGPKEGMVFPPPFHYYISFMPFLFLIVSLCINKLLKKNFFLAISLITIFILYSLLNLFSNHNNGFSMPLGWNYIGIQKASQIILGENKKNYNIANLLSGDTRDYPLRYLLTAAGKPPLEVDQYPRADNLFVISKHEKEKTVNNSVWEISSFCPCKLIKTWSIQNEIKLYLLQKV